MAEIECSVALCHGKPIAKGLCEKHYRRLRKNGFTEMYAAEGLSESTDTAYPGYSVSRDGAVYGKHKQLTPLKGPKGYLQVCITMFTNNLLSLLSTHNM